MTVELGTTTLCGAFLDTVEKWAAKPAFVNEVDGTWHETSFAEYRDMVAQAAAGLQRMGIRRRDPVLLLVRTRLEHHVLDLALIFLGALPISVYFGSSPQQLAYIANHSGAVLAISDDTAAYSKFHEVERATPSVKQHLIIDGRGSSGVMTYDELRSGGDLADLGSLAADVSADDWATLIYTSGTTGEPKAIPISHAVAIHAVWRFAQRSGHSLECWRALSYGPLAHSGERCFTHWQQMMVGLELTDCTNLGDLFRYIRERRPELWFAAPRLWEKLRSNIEAQVAEDPDAARRFAEARQVGWDRFQFRQAGRPVPPALENSWLAYRESAVDPILALVGLDAAKITIAGSAPMSYDLQKWWLSVGVDLSDCYGMTETMVTSWSPERITLGSAGTALPGMELKLADNGEILIRGPYPFPGYFKATGPPPVDADGFYHTGDLGEFDESANLRIIDRLSDILVPTSGHNVSPAHLEAGLTEHPLIGQAFVVGTGRPYCGALVLLDPVAAPVWAAEHGFEARSLPDLRTAPYVEDAIRDHVSQINDRYPRSEQVGALAIVGDSWVLDSEFVTPTNKLRRAKIRQHYAEFIDTMYRGPDIRNGAGGTAGEQLSVRS